MSLPLSQRKGENETRLRMLSIILMCFCAVVNIQTITASCFLSFRNDLTFNQPLLVSNYDPIFYPLDGASHDGVDIRRDESVRLVCPNSASISNSFPKFINRHVAAAKCKEGKQFLVDGKPHLFESLQCLHQVRPSEKRTNAQCLGKNTELIQIGYPVDNDFVVVYEVCFHKEELATLYAKVIVSPDLGKNLIQPAKTNAWITNLELFKSLNVAPSYSCEGQKASFKNILGKSFLTGNCCYDKGQLVPDKDLAYGSQQLATYHYLNAVPQYSTCGKVNWAEIENRVRRLAKNLQRPLTVWTGQSSDRRVRGGGRLNLFHYDLYLHHTSSKDYGIPVPQFIWKIIYDVQSQNAVVIIQINQDVTLADLDSLTLCRDICYNINWLNFLDRTMISKGYTYCCDLNDFEFGFGFKSDSPFPKSVKGVLRDEPKNKW